MRKIYVMRTCKLQTKIMMHQRSNNVKCYLLINVLFEKFLISIYVNDLLGMI